MNIKDIERQMGRYEYRISLLESVIASSTAELNQKIKEYRDFKREHPHPDNKGGSGKYGAWTFEDTLEEVRNVRERNEQNSY